MAVSPHSPARTTLVREQLFRELRTIVGEASDEELLGLIDMFHSTAAERVAEARAALHRGDLATLRRAGHTLKSMGAYIGVWRLAGIAARLEHWVVDNLESGRPSDLARAEAMLADIAEELATVQSTAG
jgi:HPt (histidine-containing phosphotransfer) domain-containing protein